MTTYEYISYETVDYGEAINPVAPLFNNTTRGGASWDNFPPDPEKRTRFVELHFVNFGVPVSPKTGVARLNSLGLNAPNVRDLIAVTKQQGPTLENVLASFYGVVCLHATADTEYTYFPVLRFPKHQRLELDLNIYNESSHPWAKLYLFLGVRRHKIKE